MARSRMTRKPTTPGEIPQHEYLAPLEMTQKDLADHIGQDVKVINRIVNGRSVVTAEVALKLAAAFRTTPEFWLNAQKAVDLHAARAKLRKLPKALVAPTRIAS
jgi:addiction module HigA family antidote